MKMMSKRAQIYWEIILLISDKLFFQLAIRSPPLKQLVITVLMITKEVDQRRIFFSQGRVHTYPKLEIGVLGNLKNIESRKISLLGKGSSLSVPASMDPSKENSGFPDVQGDLDAATILKQIRISNLKNVIIGQLNINSLRNKIHDLAELMKGNLDILVITETKLDYTFPEKQFLIPGYQKPFRTDRNVNGGGVMIYLITLN